MGILDIFFSHLDASKAPNEPDAVADRGPAASRAFMSLLGISKAGNFWGDGSEYVDKILKAWPGIFKWSAFFFAVRINNPRTTTPQMKRSTIDLLTACWYTISRTDCAREAILATPGSIEVATKLWLQEDAGPIPPTIDVPTGSAALDSFLKMATSKEIDRVLQSTGNNPKKVAQMAMSRYRTAIEKPHIHGVRAAVFADLLGHLSRPLMHPLRFALLSTNVIPLITKGLVTVSQQLNQYKDDPFLLEPMVASFGYLCNCLDSTDGFTWVVQAINSGLITAFLDCSPHFSRVDDPDDCDMILTVFRDILPRYLVYRSVIEAVDEAMQHISRESHMKIAKSIAKDIWQDFHRLAVYRWMVTVHAKAVKGKGTTCDNVECQKIDVKQNFRKCGACYGTTFYCSKECQVTAWEKGDHKTMCKMKQRERYGRFYSISKHDAAFFHHLSTHDARRHLPMLRELAAREFPDTPLTGLIICIDYTARPEKYTVVPIHGFVGRPAEGSVNAIARNEALLEKARDYPGKYTLIQSTISNGRGDTLVMTLATGEFWMGDVDPRDIASFEKKADELAAIPHIQSRKADLAKAREIIAILTKRFGESCEVDDETSEVD
ncbi:hypothetical protein PLICRDRAFT_106414 [Plicaturopsis crispa FD-325 SS-3]|nr:hypothetical protein PLICRDRAFT_106414 [Plicaturopsis crispa FD-325 SS-3]